MKFREKASRIYALYETNPDEVEVNFLSKSDISRLRLNETYLPFPAALASLVEQSEAYHQSIETQEKERLILQAEKEQKLREEAELHAEDADSKRKRANVFLLIALLFLSIAAYAFWVSQSALNDITKKNKEVARLILDNAEKDIFNMAYEAALEKVKGAATLDVLEDELAAYFIELVLVHNAKNNFQRVSGILDTIQRELQYKELETLSTAIQKRELVTWIEKYYPSIKEKYYPKMIEIKGGTFEKDYIDIFFDYKPKYIGLDSRAKGYRLPTEAEWEYAAKGAVPKQKRVYSGGNDLENLAWYNDNNKSYGTKPVGKKRQNNLGIYDMSGNVWEWCEDGYSDYEKNPKKDYRGTQKKLDAFRVSRGGGWSHSSEQCRVASRNYWMPSIGDPFIPIGFRIVLSQ
jgi:hypothetical protein